MRLRLNTTLRAALIAAITAVGFTLSQATASTVLDGQTYSGDVYTWSKGGTSQEDMAYGGWKKTTQGNPGYIYEDAITKWDPTIKSLIANGGSTTFTNDLNTIRFAAGVGSNTNMKYTFAPLSVGGIIVEDAGYTITASGGNRAVYIGNATATAARSDIKGDFTINTSGATDNGTMTFMGTQTWNVASDATFTLNSGNYAKTVSGALSITGGGTVAFVGAGTISMTADSSLEIQSGSTVTFSAAVTGLSHTITNAGTVNFGGTVSVADFSGFKGTAEYSNEGNGFIIAGKYTLVEGAGTVTGLTQISHGGSMLDVDQTDYTVSVTDADYTAYYLNTANASVVVDDAAAEAATHQQTLTTVNVKNTGTTVTVNSEQALDTLSIAEGMGTTVNGTGTLAVNSNVAIGNGGSLAIASGTTLKVANAASAKALMMSGAVTNNGTFELACDMQLDAGVSTVMAGALKVDSGATLKLSNNKGNPTSIASFSSVELAGGNLWANTTMRTINALSVTGDSQISFEDFPDAYDNNPTKFDGNTLIDSGKTLTIYTNYKSRVQIAHLTGAGTLKLTTANRNDNGENVTIDSLTGFTGSLNLEPGNANNPVRVTAALGNEDVSMGTLSLNGNSGAASANKHTFFKLTGDHNLTLKGIDGTNGEVSLTVPTLTLDTDSNHSYTGALAISGQLVKTGEGSQTISGYVMSRAMDVQAGTLVLNGTYSIDGITDGSVVTKYLDDKGVESLNGGFKEQSGTKTVYSVEDGASVNTDNAHFTYGGSDVTDAVKVGGTYVIPSSGPDYTTLHVIAGELSLAPYKQKSQDEGSSISNIVITADAKLVADNDYTGALSVIGEGTGLLDILSSNVVSLSSQDQDLELSGQGTYALGEGTTSMGNVTLGDDWFGIVRITNATANSLEFGNLAKDASAIEMKGYTGWSQNWNGNITQNIILTDNDDSAAWSNGAFTSKAAENPEAVFSGEWSGSGTFKRTGGNKMNYKFTGDISDWDGKFLMVDGGTTTLSFAGNATDVQAAIDKDGNSTLNVVVGDGENSFTTMFGNTITANSLTVQANANATFTRDLDVATITVNADGTMNMEGGTLSTAITNNGTVSLSGITLGDGFVENGGEDTYVAVDGTTTVTDEDNYYLGNARGYVTVVTGSGEVSGSDITWHDGTFDLQDDGTITTTAAGTNFDTFYINKGSEQISDILANDTTAVRVNAGILVVNQDATGVNITVTDEGTISGDKADAKQVNIAEGATAYYTGGVEDSGVKFTPSELIDGAVEVDNYGQTQKYSIASRDLSVAAAALEMTGTEDVTVSNYVVVNKLVNTTGKVLTLDNVDALMLTDMSITNSTVQVYTNLAKDTEATVAIAGILQGGGATLKADLTLFGGSTLDVDGGAANALTLGSMLTIDTSKALVNLDEDTIAALNQLAEGQYLDLIKAAEQTTLSYTGAQTGMNYDDLFSRVGGVEGVYTVYAHDNAFGLVKGSNVPEPTTGTLSLLALAALAARRRRK